MIKIVLTIIGIVGIVCFAIFLYSWHIVQKSLSAANVPVKETPESYNLKYESRTFKTSDGIVLNAWYVPVKTPKAVVIVVHGYRDVKGSVVKHSTYLHAAGYTSFFIDLRSDDLKTKATLGIQEYKDLQAAYEYMRSLPENSNKKIGFFGGSMGASTSIIAAGKTGTGDFVIANVPFANFKSLFATRLRLEDLHPALLPFVQLANAQELGWDYENYSPDKLIKNINKPIILVSAANDTKVNPQDSKDLFDLANEPKYYWNAENSGHDIYSEHPEIFSKRILEFLETIK